MSSCNCEKCRIRKDTGRHGAWLDNILPEAVPQMRGQAKLLSEFALNKAFELEISDSIHRRWSLNSLYRPYMGYQSLDEVKDWEKSSFSALKSLIGLEDP